MSLLSISREERTKQIVLMGRRFSFPYVDIQSNVPQSKFFLKNNSLESWLCFPLFCGGHKNNLRLLVRSSFNNYSFEFTATETSAGGTLLYIANHLSYKCRNDLNIYKKNELESTFIEIVNPKKSNIIVGVIYRHPSMDLTDFNCNYLNKLLENISKEQKSIFLLGDFNVNLLNYNEHNQANEFLDSLASNSFMPLILQSTTITSHSNTLIDNIFSNVIDPDIISGNLIATISDHLPQFSIIPKMFGNISSNKFNIYEKNSFQI